MPYVFSRYVPTRRSIVDAIEAARSVSASSARWSTCRAPNHAASAVASRRQTLTAAAAADGRKRVMGARLTARPAAG